MIGVGSFGVVVRAEDGETGDHVALKILRPEALGQTELLARFRRESQVAEQLRHSGTVELLGTGVYDLAEASRGVPYMVQELVRGIPLGMLLEFRGRFSPEEAVHVMAGVLDTLHHAHMHGVLHRDLKPNNILLEVPRQGRREPGDGPGLTDVLGVVGLEHPVWQDLTQVKPRVVDFGLAKLLEVGGRKVPQLTRKGFVAGTAFYMSPEQVAGGGREIDHRADIYGAAMLLYRLLTGKQPYADRADSLVEIARMHAAGPALELPDDLADHAIAPVFGRGAAKDPEARWETAGEMAWELRCAVDPTLLERPRPLFQPPPRKQRSKWFLGRLLRG